MSSSTTHYQVVCVTSDKSGRTSEKVPLFDVIVDIVCYRCCPCCSQERMMIVRCSASWWRCWTTRTTKSVRTVPQSHLEFLWPSSIFLSNPTRQMIPSKILPQAFRHCLQLFLEFFRLTVIHSLWANLPFQNFNISRDDRSVRSARFSVGRLIELVQWY